VLDDAEAQEVPLRREFEYLQLYLSIEQARFQDRLRVEISNDPAVLDAMVPQMFLQPIVENAIRHGIGRSSAADTIRISAARVDGGVGIKVEDDGPGFTSTDLEQGSGIGLSNTRARLDRLYGGAARLVLANRKEGGAVVTVVLPQRRSPEFCPVEVMEVDAADHASRR
jgi:two-component system, LytTR family, sensor kinase